MFYEARRWLQSCRIWRAGEEFAALIRPPMRAAEAAKTTEQIVKRLNMRANTKRDRIMVGIYLAARQGGAL